MQSITSDLLADLLVAARASAWLSCSCCSIQNQMQSLADGKHNAFLADKRLTFASEFPSNPADVIKSATLEFVLKNLACIRLRPPTFSS